jgi:hypothetical protein
MNRVLMIQRYINTIFDQITSPEMKAVEIGHIYGVAQLCSLLASRRGLDMELAYITGLLHDIYRSKTGVGPYHAHNGAEMLRVAFKNELAGFFSEEEQTIIKSAVYHHSDKAHVHDAYDELLKDADALQHFLFDNGYATQYEAARLNLVLRELGIKRQPVVTEEAPEAVSPKACRSSLLADIAENLSGKQIAGERDDADYMRIIRYFPEESAFDELKNGWCAAFVYHCCQEAGLTLPIRMYQTAEHVSDYRLACVRAWYEWGSEQSFCHEDKDGFVPDRGDIVIYNNIIPKENKKENGFWGDHIGIVVGVGDDALTVAEGNVGNLNVSGLVSRKRDVTIGCYLRIPEEYIYDGWRIDYKTGKIRVVDFVKA